MSITIWSLQFLLYFLFHHFSDVDILSYPALFLIALVSFILTYALIRFHVEKFIFRKIKLIYKVISNTKDSLKDRSLSATYTTLEDVNDKAVEWAMSTEKEISTLKSLENYRKQYLGDVSHELKTPLFSIQGYLLTLLEGGIHDEKINIKYLKKASENVDRMQAIVEDLEMINMLESEDEGLEKTIFELKQLSDSVISDLVFQAKEKNIQLVYKPGANQSYKVLADKEKIRQVFINLIENSIKYGNENGKTKISFYDMESRILIEVSDDGIGIGEEDIKHVYDRFYRADKSRSREIGGSGLGLAIVKHIIEAHGQTLSLRSTDGKGSTFGFTLEKK